MKDFKNQVAIVTGASSGIGDSITRILAKNRARVVLAARRQERLSTIVEDLRADNTEVIAVPTDVRDRAQAESLIDAAVTQFGRLDMLICCAGIYYRLPTYELTLVNPDSTPLYYATARWHLFFILLYFSNESFMIGKK